MKTLLVTLAAAATLAACAGMPADGDQVAESGYTPLDCKVVVVDSTAQSMRLANGAKVDGDEINRAEGAQQAARLYARPPRQLRAPPGSGLVNNAFYGC